MKNCSKCGLEKSLSEFYSHKLAKDGKHSWCKECVNSQATKWRHDNPEKCRESRRKSKRKHTTGYTHDEYDLMFVKQGGCCAICGKHQSEFKRALAADHCHSTKAKRGLLCINCNTALGKFNDDVKLLKNAIDYLEKGY